MRIEPTASVAATGETQATGRTSRSADDGSAVQVSPRVGELGRAATQSQNDRAQRIAQLRDAINHGTYQVDRAKLAVSIAEEELALAGGGS